MEIRVLQYFLAVAREQSIIRAAESLHLTQPTLSTQIRDMEKELGTQLLIRGTKGSRKILLTNEGMILRDRAEEIMEMVNKTGREISLAGKTISGDIDIGTGETDAVRMIARTASALKTEYPDIHYHIHSGNAEYVADQIEKGLIDFGIVVGPVDRNRYDSLLLPVKDIWGVLMRSDAPLAKKKYITAKDIYDKPLIITQQGDSKKLMAAILKKKEEDLNIIATYNLLFNASLMVEEGLGYAICLDKIIHTTADGPLCFRPLKPSPEMNISIIWKKYQVFTKATSKFLEYLKDSIRQ